MKYAKEIIKEIKNREIIDTDNYIIDDDWENYIRGKRKMTKEEAIKRVKGYLTDYLPTDCYEEVEEIIEALKQDPFINKPCISSEVCEHDKQKVLDKIRAEIEQLPTNTRINWDGCCPDIDYPEIEYVDVTKNALLSIIDKYKAESKE